MCPQFVEALFTSNELNEIIGMEIQNFIDPVTGSFKQAPQTRTTAPFVIDPGFRCSNLEEKLPLLEIKSYRRKKSNAPFTGNSCVQFEQMQINW